MTFFRTTYKQIAVRPRLGISILIGTACFLINHGEARLSTRALLSWDVAIGLYIVLALSTMLRSDLHMIRARAKDQDDGALAVLLLTVMAAIASVAAIVLELRDVKHMPAQAQTLHFILVGATLVGSWALIHITFALHYAHVYYIELQRGGSASLEFGDDPEPNYVDFLYFSFVIGTTSQTADVNIASRRMRRIALLHGVLAFFFNTSLLALTVNIVAGQI